jgi:hypothetical protein
MRFIDDDSATRRGILVSCEAKRYYSVDVRNNC